MRTMITAHSGCEGYPDNSLEYVRHALCCGADALEIDVHPRPGGFYISHDPSDAPCPDLGEVFSLVRESGIKVNCDLKHPGIEYEVLELARSFEMESRLLFSGYVSREAMEEPEIRKRTLWNIESAMPEFYEQSLAEIPFTAAQIREAAEVYLRYGAVAANLYYGFCDEERLSFFREKGIALSVWTVNDEAAARRFLNAGVFNITSRQPTMVRRLRDETPA